jgi:Kef-type K+ transport system membrane component KefB
VNAETTVHLFLSVAILLVAAKLFGVVATRIGQPQVVGEIIAGILAGPLMLPEPVRAFILPPSVAPLVQALASIGLALFMFTVGYELDAALLRGRKRAAFGIAAGSVLLPVIGGTLLGLALAAHYAPGSHLGFVLFLGLAMAVTAFPVLARILAEHGLTRQPIGGVCLAAAAVGDVAAWVALAGVAAFTGNVEPWRVALLPVYVLVLFGLVRPLLGLRRYTNIAASPGPAFLSLVTAGLLLSCAATEWLGVHFIFGAFAFGAAMPRTGLERLRASVVKGVEYSCAVLLPLYFVVAGSKMSFVGFGGSAVLVIVVVIAVGVISKGAGAYGAARLSGLPHRDALPVSVLMNVRGLTEIVILSAGLDLGLIDSRIYSVMVVMAVITTAMAGPLLRIFGVGDGPAVQVASRSFIDRVRRTEVSGASEPTAV